MIAPVPERRPCLLLEVVGRNLFELLHEPLKARILRGSLQKEMEVIWHEAVGENVEAVALREVREVADAGVYQSGICEAWPAVGSIHGSQIRVGALVVEAL